jgi:hypothetical protein
LALAIAFPIVLILAAKLIRPIKSALIAVHRRPLFVAGFLTDVAIRYF